MTLLGHLSPDRTEKEIAAHVDEILAKSDGVFAATDTIAIALMRELQKRKVAIPSSLRLVGFGDLPVADQTSPTLTTIHQDIAGGASALVDLLLRRVGGEESESLILPPKLVIRETA